MRAADLATAVVLMGLGGLVMFDAVRLGYDWGSDGPKSGFFPFWLAVALVVTSGLIVVQALRRHSPQPFVSREQLRPVLAVLVPATAMVLIMEVAGLYVASALYVAFYMRWVGRHRWITIALLALGLPLATFVIFERWFLVPMPKGPLEAWLGL
ncbi:MAG: tricarboxylate transporter [Candidatus Rokuibacteriota bacterium]|nr:MAG: tricarboxylate transporter [Candidatus Rokubacteria bacterium]